MACASRVVVLIAAVIVFLRATKVRGLNHACFQQKLPTEGIHNIGHFPFEQVQSCAVDPDPNAQSSETYTGIKLRSTATTSSPFAIDVTAYITDHTIGNGWDVAASVGSLLNFKCDSTSGTHISFVRGDFHRMDLDYVGSPFISPPCPLDLQLSTVTCSTQCNLGRGVDRVCGFNAPALCTVLCRSDQFTNQNQCQTCPSGYTSNAARNACVDINECQGNHGCPSGKICVNNPGSFDCIDVNECEEDPDFCAPGFTCVNTDGSADCVDIDECASGQFSCPVNSQCDNVPGSYNCMCDLGFAVAGSSPATRVGNSDSTCYSLDYSIDATNFRSTKATVDIQGAELPFNIGLYVVDEKNRRFEVDQFETDTRTFELEKLVPGTSYQVVAFAAAGVPGGNDPGVAVRFVTACTCQDIPANEENGNGKPQNFLAFQENGLVYFSFTDASLCEEAYSFERRNPHEGGTSVFAPNYYFQAAAMCGDQFSPGQAAADKLALSKLEIGKEYIYCARAIAAPAYTSASSCTNHTIEWQASVNIHVTLTPDSGRLPVRQVEVAYFLTDHQGNAIEDGTVTTDEDGKAFLSFSVLPTVPTALDSVFSLQLRFSKAETFANGTIEHTFLCENGVLDCSSAGLIVSLRHLEFGKSVAVEDDTSLPVRGLAVVAGTGEPGCPLPGVDICLSTKQPRSTTTPNQPGNSLCVSTNSNGEFSIPAVIGTTVGLVARYKNHEFEFVHSRPDILEAIGSDSQGPGVVIRPGEFYEGFLFKDMTRATLSVAVVGGLCDRSLGTATLKYGIVGCKSWESGDLAQHGPKGEYLVPAHRIEMSATVFAAEDLGSKQIDLSNIEQEEDNANSTDFAPGSDLTVEEANTINSELEEEERQANALRFQFNGQIQLQFDALNNRAGDCSSNYPVVLPAYRLAMIRVRVLETFPLSIPSCDVFPRDAKLFITNKLGLNPVESISDRDFRETIESEAKLLQEYEFCNTGCEIGLSYDEGLDGANVNAHVLIQVRVGPPNLVAIDNSDPLDDYLKTLSARFTQGTTTTAVDLSVLVVGDYDQGFVDSVNLPTHKPVMILRDPPGGLSSATYENMETVFKVTFDKYEKRQGFDIDERWGGHYGFTKDVCIGASPGIGGPVSALCSAVKHKISSHFLFDADKLYVSELSDDTHTAEYSTTWSFTTSSNPWIAGKLSDVFVVPTINLEFNRVVEIGLDPNTCLSTNLNKVKFAVAKESAVSFLTFMDLTTFEIPSYQATADSIAEQLLTETDQARIDFLIAARGEALDAITSWQGIISEYEETNEEAKNRGGNYSVRPDEWFDKLADDQIDAKGTLKNFYDKTFKSGLIPTRLADEAEAVRDTSSSLDVTDVITFSGGGTTYNFQLKEAFKSEEVHLKGTAFDNFEGSFQAGFDLSFKGWFDGVGVDLHHSSVYKQDEVKVKTYTKGKASDSAISFKLGDPDIGDKFNVQIAIDKKYKSFVFTLKSTSRTRCPHEENSVRRESPRIELIDRPTSPVLPNEPMVFRLRLTNDGRDRSAFHLYTDLRQNPDGLTMRFLMYPHTIDYIDPQESMETTVQLRRGPKEYTYNPLNVTLRSACEFSTFGDGNMFGIPDLDRTQATTLLFNDDATRKIIYAQPCSQVSIAKPRGSDKIVVNAEDPLSKNVEIVVRNTAAAAEGSLQSLLGSTRLETVSLKFRQKGLTKALSATYLDGESQVQEVEFADDSKEDELGFSRVIWNIEDDKLVDGEYEVWVESICTEIDGAPPGFNEYQTSVLSMVVDRSIPKLFGTPEPAAGDIFVGEPVLFHFTEKIDCYKFKLEVLVEGINRVFDNKVNNNLLVLCEDRTVAFQFDASNQNLDDLIGKKFNMTMTDVADVHGNQMEGNVFHALTFATVDLTSVSVRFEVVIDRNCTLTAEALTLEIIAVLQLPEAEHNRVQVSNLRCSGPSRMTATVTILTAPPQNSNSTLRRLLYSESPAHAVELFYQLRDLTGKRRSLQSVSDITGLDGFVSMSKLQVIPDKENIQERVFYIPNAPAAEQSALVDAKLANMQMEVSAVHQDMQLAVAGLAVGFIVVIVAIGMATVVARRKSKSATLEHYVDSPQSSVEHDLQRASMKQAGPPI